MQLTCAQILLLSRGILYRWMINMSAVTSYLIIFGEELGEFLMPPLRCFFLGDSADCWSSSTATKGSGMRAGIIRRNTQKKKKSTHQSTPKEQQGTIWGQWIQRDSTVKWETEWRVSLGEQDGVDRTFLLVCNAKQSNVCMMTTGYISTSFAWLCMRMQTCNCAIINHHAHC